MNVYLTADSVGNGTGGGTVTQQEWQALQEFGEPALLLDRNKLDQEKRLVIQAESRETLQVQLNEPWVWDHKAFVQKIPSYCKLAHVYSGTFTNTVQALKNRGAKVAYTAAAHDIHKSKAEYEALGFDFSYPHLTDPVLWQRYLGGYLSADLVICPSLHSKQLMLEYGCRNVVVIPHGIPEVVETPRPQPSRFTVGYLGAVGPDKGLRYLLQAWKQLNYKDAILLVGGRDSTSDFVRHLYETEGGGSVVFTGYVRDTADFYAALSLYVQPSVTEGFGIEVLEAMAQGRATICSAGAGAADVLPVEGMKFPPRDVRALAELIDTAKKHWDFADVGLSCRDIARDYTWDKIRPVYQEQWRKLL